MRRKSTGALAGLGLVGVAFIVGIGPVRAARPFDGRQPAPAASPTVTSTPTATPTSAPPTQVFLAFAEPAPMNPSDPCRTGVIYRTNAIGDHDEIVVCTFDSSGAPAPTDTSSARLEWRISGDQSEPGVRFNPAPPPAETGGAGASAQAGVDAFREGGNFIDVSLLDASGAVVDQFSLEKDVFACDCPRNIPTWLTARKAGRLIRGRARSAEPECEPRRDVTLFRRRKGTDEVIGSDRTSSLGEWSVETGRRPGAYYGRVSAAFPEDPETGGQSNCLADQSEDVRRGR